MSEKRELYFWRIATGASLVLTGVFAVRSGSRQTPTPTQIEQPVRHKEANRRYPSAFFAAQNGPERALETTEERLAALKKARSPANICEALNNLAKEDGGSEVVVSAIVDFTTAPRSRFVRQCATAALGVASSEAATSFLTEILEDPDPSMSLAAVDALAARRDPDAKQAVLDAAHSENSELSRHAVLALARAGAPEAVPLIVAALRGESGDTAMQLISALGSTKTPEATPALIELVETRKGKTRIAAISALGDLGGEAATRALARAIGSGVEDSRVAVRALAQIGDEGSRKVLLDLASSGDREASLEALRGLSDAEGDDVRQVMTAALGSADPDRASSAAAYFGEHGDAAAIPALTAMTRTGGTAAAQYALSAIAAIGGDPARLALADLARHGGGMQAHALAQLGALPGGHAEARGIALDVLHNGGAGISAAFETLVRDGSKEARDALIEVARGHTDVAAQAMHALARDGDTAALDALSAIARSEKDTNRRMSALAALASSSSPSSVPVLLEAATSAEPSIRVQGLSGLSALGGPDAERAFLVASRDTDSSVASSAMQYLGEVRTPSALGRLEEIALGTNPGLTEQALGALAQASPARAASVTERLLGSQDPETRASAVRVASNLPGAQAEQFLTTAARDPDANVAKEAIMNLQAVGGPAVQGILLDVLKNESAASEVRAAAAQVLNQLGGNAAEENAALIDELITPPDTGSE